MRTGVEQHLRALRRLPGQNRVLAYTQPVAPPRGCVSSNPTRSFFTRRSSACVGSRGSSSGDGDRNGSGSCAVRKSRCHRTTDTDHSAVLDEWLDELAVDAVHYTSRGHAGTLLPRTATGGHHEGTDRLRRRHDRAHRPAAQPSRVPSAGRRLYRATELPYWFGSQGQLKHRIGQVAADSASRLGLRTDISTRPDDAILGDQWLEFLASGRAVVGAESNRASQHQTDPSGKPCATNCSAAAPLDLRRGERAHAVELGRLPVRRVVTSAPRSGAYRNRPIAGRRGLSRRARARPSLLAREGRLLGSGGGSCGDPRSPPPPTPRRCRLRGRSVSAGATPMNVSWSRSTNACACSVPASDDVGRSRLGLPPRLRRSRGN